MRVLITGGFGYLGSRLTQMLPYDVVLGARSRPPWAVELNGHAHFCQLDVLNAAQIEHAVANVNAVIHLASLDEHEAARDPDLAVRVSGEGTRRLLAACRATRVSHFIYMSTFHVYGPSAPSLLDEDTPTRPAHPYGISRLTGEGYCYENNRVSETTRATVLRLSNSYGAPAHIAVDRWTLAHNDFCRQAFNIGKIVLRTDGSQHRDMVWIGDLAQAVGLVLGRRRLQHELLHLGSGSSLSMIQLAERVRAAAEDNLQRSISIECPSSNGRQAQPIRFSIDRLRALGFEPNDAIAEETHRILDLLRKGTA